MKEIALEAPKTGRCYIESPTPPQASEKVLFALHGYGQLPAFFIRHFAPLVEAGWTVVAPEGLHRFYVSGTSGRVGASWMTKEDRETDISDTMKWLEQVRHEVLGAHRPRELVLLGFSQGVSAAMRWAALRGQAGSWDRLVFWAGVLPPDLVWTSEGLHMLQSTPIDTVLGDDDPFFDAKLTDDSHRLLTGAGLVPTHHSYAGGHRVNGDLLVELLKSTAR